MKRTLLTIGMLLSAFLLIAQDAAMIIGDTGTGNGFGYTVGQIAYQQSFQAEAVAQQIKKSEYEIFEFAIADESLKSDLEVLIYPNPTVDLLNIEVKDNSQVDLFYQILKITGELQSSGKLILETTEISTTNLLVGTYFIKIVQDDRTIKTVCVIKK